MKIKPNIGIISYGTALPTTAISLVEIEKAQKKIDVGKSLSIFQKTVPNLDQDSITLATDAGVQTLDRTTFKKENIGAIFIGSESHPYAVNPSGTVVAQALGLSNQIATADLQFACKAGTQAIQIGLSYVQANMARAVLAIGTDTAQAAPGDALEFSASAAAASYLIGKKNVLAKILYTTSYASDTPDFWRRPKQSFPSHAGRFTGEPAYFHHIIQASKNLLTQANISPKKIRHCVFHTPNGKFPRQVALKLGFNFDQLQYSLVVEQVGNSYAAAVPLALANVLDHAKSGELIFVCSYGSGAGADSFLLQVTPELGKRRKRWTNFVQQQIDQLSQINYQQYQTFSIQH